MIRTILQYISIIVFLGIGDYLWFHYLAGSIYQDAVGTLLMFEDDKMILRMDAVAGVYLAMAMLILLFVIIPDNSSPKWILSVLKGAILGMLVYAVYQFTNHAVLKSWSSDIILPDVLWGGILFAFSTSITLTLTRILSKR